MRALLLALLALPILIAGCKKEPGEGGRAEIHGTVYEQRYSGTGLPIGEPYPVAEQRVYIIYGDGDYADDDTRTEPNGSFRFPWLRKGEYRVYAVSECDNANCKEGIYVSGTITGRKEILDIGTINIRNY